MGRRIIHDLNGKIMRGVIHETNRRGLAALKVPKVAERAGVTESVVYMHFNTKQELVDRTFAYVWKKLPWSSLYPLLKVNPTDPFFERRCRSYFADLLGYNDEIIFLESYFHSEFMHPEFIEKVQTPVLEIMAKENAPYLADKSAEEIRFFLSAFLKHLFTEMAPVVRGIVLPSDDNMRRIYRLLFVGTYGVLVKPS